MAPSDPIRSSKPEPPLPLPSLLVGLGNPGSKYDRTRHNIGFDVLDRAAQRWQFSWTENRKFQGFFAETLLLGQKIRVLKPTTYMNNSGQAIRAVVDWYKLSPASVLLIYDDMDLPLGRLRMRLKGSAGGHNGMKSTIAHLGTPNFPRLRLGIGSPRQGEGKSETVSHVLSKFAPEEQATMQEAIDQSLYILETIFSKGWDIAMNRCNA
ncbi:MAG: aminoacyl-tRNA hydrolase [Prochlorotrichaceae cyanobacterium]